jgi:hypothetical protein
MVVMEEAEEIILEVLVLLELLERPLCLLTLIFI